MPALTQFLRKSRAFTGAIAGGTLIAILGAGSDVSVYAGDLLRGGYNSPTGRGMNPGSFTPPSVSKARANAQDALARATQAIEAVQQMQQSARALATRAERNNLGINPNQPAQQLPNVPNGLGSGRLNPAAGATAGSSLWSGATLPTETASKGNDVVTVVQTKPDAVLTWQSFNVGSATTLDFNQSAGGKNVGNWIAFNVVIGTATAPSQILGSIKAQGQVYVIDQNGIIFGGGSLVNVHALVASSLPINDNLLDRGLLNNPDDQFLFSQLAIPAGSNGPTPAFNPPAPMNGQDGNVTVDDGAQIIAPETADNVGGRVTLVGPNVTNAGTINTPDGQTILAAGEQVGFLASSDASLRGLRTYVGAVDAGTGVVTNTGLIEVDRGDATMVGKSVNQLGAIDSTTSVTLNGRIDLDAAYGTDVVSIGNGQDLFAPTESGMVTLGAGSVSEILPELSSAETVVGSALALPSQVNIEGETIHFAANSQILAPDASVSVAAGGWVQQGQDQAQLIPNSGQIYFDAGASINVAGSIVSAPVSENIIAAQLLGPQLANFPLQRNGALYGQTVMIDARETGIYDGEEWVGTPFADVSGYIDLIQRPVGELTTGGGAVDLTAGGSVVMQPTSEINVSGGAINYQGGMVQTSDLISGGHIYDIADATPDLVYQGVLGNFTTDHPKWGISSTFGTPLLGGPHYEASYVEGGNGGAINIAAPSVALDGVLTGNISPGSRQLQVPPSPSSLTLSFQMQTGPSSNSLTSPTPPHVFFEANPGQDSVAPFAVDASGAPLALPADRQADVYLSPNLLTEGGFGSLTVNNGDGDVTVPANVTLNAGPWGSVTLNAANLNIEGTVSAPNGTLNFTVYDFSPYAWLTYPAGNPTPVENPARGQFILGAGASLDVSGLVVNDGPFSPVAGTEALATSGGTITINSYSADLMAGSTINVSGGMEIASNARPKYGAGGAISISAGADPDSLATLGGKLTLDAQLEGFSGSTGGSLSIEAPAIQIGGDARADTLLLQPAFFSQGGFASYALEGLGNQIGGSAFNVQPGILISPGTVLKPVAENWLATGDLLEGDGTLTPILLPEAQRTPVSLSFRAPGVVNTQNELIVRGDFVMGSGAMISLDALGSVSISGNTASILGMIEAPGGTITISGARDSSLIFDGGSATSPLTTVCLGPNAELSVAGATVLTPDALGNLTGTVFAGGNISVSGNIVAAAGSVLNASGASGVVYLPNGETAIGAQGIGSFLGGPEAPFRVDSNGGSITLTGQQELFTDATLLGAAGGPAAIGGSLTISSGQYVPESEIDSFTPSPTTPTLFVTQAGPTIPGRAGIGEAVPGANGQVLDPNGQGHIAVASFQDGGFNAINLAGTVQFDGGVRINAGGSLSVASGGVIIANGAVSLSAPYVALGMPFEGPLTPSELTDSPFGNIYFDPTSGPGSLTVSADLIDIGNLSLQGIGHANFIAANGDIRGDGTLDVAGSISLTAGQIYPASDVVFTIAAYDSGTVTIHSSGSRALPLSAGGVLNVYAANIVQDGVLRAPMGTINLGWDSTEGTAPTDLITGAPVDSTATLTLGSGSITSVSAVDPLTGQALIIPYGSNPTGTAWIDPAGNNITAGGLPGKTINLAATSIADESGSVIDLRGGGDLSAYRFVAGENGTTDFLGSGPAWNAGSYTAGQLVSYKGATWVALQRTTSQAPAVNQYWAQVPASYAVIPGYQAKFAPYAPFNSTTGDPGYVSAALQTGEQVYLGAGSGLAAGIYTLLPARYALLPGAFLVTPESGAPVAGQTLPDGSNFVSGYLFNGLSKPGGVTGALISRFEVDSQAVVLGRGKYDTFLASTFFSHGSTTSQPLPNDAGILNIEATSSLELQGSVNDQGADGGTAGFVSISSPANIEITGNGAGGAAGTLTLSAAELDSFGAANLLIGGEAVFGAEGLTVTVQTNNLEVNNSAVPLSGPEIILVANDGVKIDAGAEITGAGAAAGIPARLLVQDSTELSAGEPLTLGKGGVPVSFPAGTPGDDTLVATAGVTITLATGASTTVPAGSSFRLAAGSTVTLNGPGTLSFAGGTGGGVPLMIGDGALVQVSSGAASEIERNAVAGSESVSLSVGAGATISGASETLSSTYATSLDPTANLTAGAITLGSGQISIVLNSPGTVQPTTGLVLQGKTLANLVNSQSVTLESYSTIDVYGSGVFGGAGFGNLTLEAGAIVGFNDGGGTVTFQAKSITLGNLAGANGAGTTAAAGSGALQFDGGIIELGSNEIDLDQYATVALNATGGIISEGSGTLATQGSLDLNAPLITGAAGSNETISTAGALDIAATAGSTPAVSGAGLDAKLTLQGASVTDNGNITALSGAITLRATSGDVAIGTTAATTLDAEGTAPVLLDATKYTNGGTITLTADGGSVDVGTQATLDVAAQIGGGNAGTIAVNTPQGSVNLQGTLMGEGGAGGKNGTFSLDAGTILSGGKNPVVGDLDTLIGILGAGGFKQSVTIRDRNDSSVTIGATATANSFSVSADAGTIAVSGLIDASGVTGGTISLIASGSVILENGAVLTVAGQNFDSAGQGGAVTLEAGAYTGGNFTNVQLGAGPQVNIETGSTIDLSVAANTTAGVTAANAALGRCNGTLLIAAPQALGNQDVQIQAIDGTIKNASSIVVAGVQVFNATDGSVDNQEANVLANGNTFAGTAGAPATAGYTAMIDRLFANNMSLVAANAGMPAVAVIEPEAEIVNPNGNLTLSNDWDLGSFRFGPNSAPGTLTLRASGNLVFNGALSDGFNPSPGSLWAATLMTQNTLLPVNTQDWSYNLTAGADLTGANVADTLAAASLGGAGSLELGVNDPDPVVNNGFVGTTASILPGYYQVIRTGAGNIDISAGANVELLNQFATIYTAGTQVQDPTMGGTFVVPVLDESVSILQKSALGNAQAYAAQYSEAGGNVSIAAGEDIEHLTQDINGNLIMDSESEMPFNWLYRRGYVASDGLFGSNPLIKGGGDPAESTTWWVDFSNFFEDVGALGGGNVAMVAGQDIANVDAVIPTNARMPGLGTSGNLAPDAGSLVELGGGNLTVQAGNDINAGVYYVENGQGTLAAGDQILTNITRAPVGGYSSAQGGGSAPPQAWLPTTLFVGDGSFNVSAGGDIVLGPVANPFLLPEGRDNSIWYKTYFSTYSTSDAVDVSSLSGNITFREYASTSDVDGPLLEIWIENMDLLNSEISARSYYQPWLRLNETNIDAFTTATEVMPGTLVATAFSGDIDIVGSLLLSPSPTGTVDMAASGSINGFQSEGFDVTTNWITATIDISDANPDSIPGITSPFAYQGVAGVGTVQRFASSSDDLTDFIANYFDATTLGEPGVLQTEQTLHGQDGAQAGPLHAMDANPAELYSVTGDISGLALYSPTQTRVIAGGDITDIAFYLQNSAPGQISVVSTGGEMILYDPNSPARELAASLPDSEIAASLPGDIQIAGPGTIEVLAGGSLNLGGQGPGGASNSTGDGISSIGNTANPLLPFAGADIVASAGVGAALGLNQAPLDFSAFISQFVETAGGEHYLSELGDLTGQGTALDESQFSSLTAPQQDLVALDVFFLVLRDAGRDHNNPASPGYGNYAAGYGAIAALLPKAGSGGDIDVTARDIKTESGGNISLLTPDGSVTVGLNSSSGDDVTNLGIVTQDGGNISIFARGDVNVGTSRIFTLRGGNEIIWSTDGNIDSGASSKTVQSAPPTRVLVDPQSANVKTDLAGLATGGGIGVLASVAGVPPGNVDLIAPTGIVNAGEAGIRATGNLSIAAVAVLNAGNISVGGVATGLPPPVTVPNLAALNAVSSAQGSTANATEDMSKQPGNDNDDEADAPSIIMVQVYQYGGGDGDDDSTEPPGAGASLDGHNPAAL